MRFSPSSSAAGTVRDAEPTGTQGIADQPLAEEGEAELDLRLRRGREPLRHSSEHPPQLGFPISEMARSACFAVRTSMRSIEAGANAGNFPASRASSIASDANSVIPS
jgi:hypothetical protein